MNNQGWECPKCHRCYAPMMMQCAFCNQQPVTSTTTGLSTLDKMVAAEKQLNDWRNQSIGGQGRI